ncbi:MAG: hypothetical protein HKP19_03490 [Xanthomonadales bacterium]|nr:hypothetical protein [Xanthomonadales bacterium]
MWNSKKQPALLVDGITASTIFPTLAVFFTFADEFVAHMVTVAALFSDGLGLMGSRRAEENAQKVAGHWRRNRPVHWVRFGRIKTACS